MNKKLARKPKVVDYVGLVKKHASADNLDKAKATLQRAELAHPKATELQSAREQIQKSQVRRVVVAGKAWLERGDFIRARERFKNALAWDPTNREATHGLKKVNQQESLKLANQADTARKTRQWPKAAQLYGGALEVDPNNRDAKKKLTEIRQFDSQRRVLEAAFKKAISRMRYNQANSILSDLKKHDPGNPVLKEEAAVVGKIAQANQRAREFQKFIDAQGQPLTADREQGLLDYWSEHGVLLEQYDHPDQAGFKKRAQVAKERVNLAGKISKAVEADVDREVVAIWDKANNILNEFEPIRKLFPQIKAAIARVKAVKRIQNAAENELEDALHEIWNATSELAGSRIAQEEQAGGENVEDRCRRAGNRVEVVGAIRDLIDRQDKEVANSGFLQKEHEEAIVTEYDKHKGILKNSRFAKNCLGDRVKEARDRVEQFGILTRSIKRESDRDTIAIWKKAKILLGNYEPVRALSGKINAAKQRVKDIDEIKSAAGKEAEEGISVLWEATAGLHESRIAREEKIDGLTIADRCSLASRRTKGVGAIKALIEQQDAAVKSGGSISERVEKEILTQCETHAADFKESRYVDASIGARVVKARERIRYANMMEKAIKAEADRDVRKIWSQANGLLKNHEPIRALFPKIRAADARVIAVDQIQAVAKNEDEEQIHKAWHGKAKLSGSRISWEEQVDGQSIEARCKLASKRIKAVDEIQSLLGQQEFSTSEGKVIRWKIVEQIVIARKTNKSILDNSTYAQNLLGRPLAEAETLFAAVHELNGAVKAEDWTGIACILREHLNLLRLDNFQGEWQDYFTKILAATDALVRFVNQYSKNPMDDDSLVKAWQRESNTMDRLRNQPDERLIGRSPAAIMGEVQARWKIKEAITSQLAKDASEIDYLDILVMWNDKLCAWHESFKTLLPQIREAVAKGKAVEMIKQSLAAGQIHEVCRIWRENEDWMGSSVLLEGDFESILQSVIDSVFGTDKRPILEDKIGPIKSGIGGMIIRWEWPNEEVSDCYVAVVNGQYPQIPEFLVSTNAAQLINREMYFANAGCLLGEGIEGQFPHVGVWPILHLFGKKIPIGTGGIPYAAGPFLSFRRARLQANFEPGFLPSTKKLSLRSLSGKFDVPDLMVVYSSEGTPDRSSEVVMQINRFDINGKMEFNFKPPGNGEPKILPLDPADENWLVITY